MFFCTSEISEKICKPTSQSVNKTFFYKDVKENERYCSSFSTSRIVYIPRIYPLEIAATGRHLESTKKSTFLPVQPVYNQRESRKTIAKQSHSRVKIFNDLDAEFYYKNIEDMVRV